MAEALKHDFSLCIIEEDNIASAEQNFMKPFYDYIIQERLKIEQEGKDILLIIDETHKFSKKSKSGELVNLATQIAKYGVVLMFVTQRSEQLNIHARSQTTLQFIAMTQDDYYRSKADIHSKEWTRAMQNIKKYNLFVHGAEIQYAFEVKPLYYEKLVKLSQEEFNHYLFKSQPEKQHTAPQVLTNTNESQISNCEPKTNELLKTEIKQEPLKPKEPEKPKDELTQEERKIVEFLKAYGKDYTSANKLFRIVLNLHSGESPAKISNSLVAKGYITIEKPHPKKSIIRLTEKGKV